jgi:hypothetical protein
MGKNNIMTIFRAHSHAIIEPNNLSKQIVQIYHLIIAFHEENPGQVLSQTISVQNQHGKKNHKS